VAARPTLAFPVFLSSDAGLARAIARKLDPDGMFVEAPAAFPLGGRIWVTFFEESAGYELSVLAEVRFLAYAGEGGGPGPGTAIGMGLRFIEFDAKGCDVPLLGRREVVLQ
jgi:hypothetical protein